MDFYSSLVRYTLGALRAMGLIVSGYASQDGYYNAALFALRFVRWVSHRHVISSHRIDIIAVCYYPFGVRVLRSLTCFAFPLFRRFNEHIENGTFAWERGTCLSIGIFMLSFLILSIS